MAQRKDLKLLTGLLAVSLASMIWFFARDSKQALPQEVIQAEACDSCTARHQNLTRLRDARSLAARTDE